MLNHGGTVDEFQTAGKCLLNAKIKKTSETKAMLQIRQMLLCFVAEHLPFFIKIIANVWLDGGWREAKLKSIGVINEATVIEALKRNGQMFK